MTPWTRSRRWSFRERGFLTDVEFFGDFGDFGDFGVAVPAGDEPGNVGLA
jgi:hypothetical protein